MFKSGLKFKYDGNMISKISFCFHFLINENKLINQYDEEVINQEPILNSNPKECLDYDKDNVPF
jgi:hypothetical protein